MITKSKKAVNTALYIPNDPQGQVILKYLKRHVNTRTHRLRVRGRNENRRQFAETRWDHARLRQDCPSDKASYFAVYLDPIAREAKHTKWMHSLYGRIDTMATELKKLYATIDRQRTQFAELAIFHDVQTALLEQHVGVLRKQRDALAFKLSEPVTWTRVWQDVKTLVTRL